MEEKAYRFYDVIAHFGNLWFTCLDHIFLSTISVTDNDKTHGIQLSWSCAARISAAYTHTPDLQN